VGHRDANLSEYKGAKLITVARRSHYVAIEIYLGITRLD
jgi:hypothetical protein